MSSFEEIKERVSEMFETVKDTVFRQQDINTTSKTVQSDSQKKFRRIDIQAFMDDYKSLPDKSSSESMDDKKDLDQIESILARVMRTKSGDDLQHQLVFIKEPSVQQLLNILGKKMSDLEKTVSARKAGHGFALEIEVPKNPPRGAYSKCKLKTNLNDESDYRFASYKYGDSDAEPLLWTPV